jgi:hypothetical protein
MFAHEPTVRRKEKDRTIERSAVPLNDTYDQENLGIPGSLPQGITGRTRHIHSAFIIAPEILTPFSCAEANPGTEVQTYGIGGYKGLGDDHQSRSFSGRLVD